MESLSRLGFSYSRSCCFIFKGRLYLFLSSKDSGLRLLINLNVAGSMAFLGMIKKSASFLGSPRILEMRSSSLAIFISLEPFGGVEGDGGLRAWSGAML